MRGEWIEMRLHRCPRVITQSPLMRGEWIEIYHYIAKNYLGKVSPHARGVD